MLKPNILTQSKKYPTEEEMPQSVRTQLSVTELSRLRLFLDANDMQEVIIGYYKVQDPNLTFMSSNLICYAYPINNYMISANLSYMTMKFGGLEAAYKDYLTRVRVWK